jgi:eukaryotic-like serine/threonine-protein kinase
MKEKTPHDLNQTETTLKDEALPAPLMEKREETFQDVVKRVGRDLGTLSRMLKEMPYNSFSAGRVSFEVIRVLEERSNGEQVVLAERRLRHGLAGYVVVKRLHDPVRFDLRQRLVEEVQLAFRLHHPVIAQVHHLRVLEKVPYVIMEYVEGPRLDSLISAAAMLDLALPVPFVLYIASEVADALHHAHTLTEEEEGGRPLGLIHRDVSPRNIRVDRKTGAVKLTDFGAAFSKRVGREETPGRLLKGDLLYASPEYLLGAEMDARSDIFSLGLVLLEALTNRHLFNVEDSQPVSESATRSAATADETPSLPLVRMITLAEQYTAQDVERVVADLPEGLQTILRRALARIPADRYATAEEMRRDLHAQLVALAPGYGRKETAEEVARLFIEASARRDVAEPVEGGIYPACLDAHELAPGSDERRA